MGGSVQAAHTTESQVIADVDGSARPTVVFLQNDVGSAAVKCLNEREQESVEKDCIHGQVEPLLQPNRAWLSLSVSVATGGLQAPAALAHPPEDADVTPRRALSAIPAGP